MGIGIMDNRTIRNAVQKRVPEIYFIHAPIKANGKVYWRMLANIKGALYKLLADMPDTALISHKELLTTMVSEVYDEVKKIRSGRKHPPMLEKEKDWTPLTDKEQKMLGIDNLDEALEVNRNFLIEDAIPNIDTKPAVKEKGIIVDDINTK